MYLNLSAQASLIRVALAEQIVAEVASGLTRSLSQLKAVFKQSLAAHQQLLPNVEGVVAEMRKAGMLEAILEEEATRTVERLRATRLGHIAVRHFLSPATMLLFRDALSAHHDLTFLDLLMIAASSEDCEPILPVDFEELDTLAAHLAPERSILFQWPRSEIEELLRIDGKRLLSTLKTALVGRDWTRLSDVREVAERHDCYPLRG